MKVTIDESVMPENATELRLYLEYLDKMGVAYILHIDRVGQPIVSGASYGIKGDSIMIDRWTEDGSAGQPAVPVPLRDIESINIEITG